MVSTILQVGETHRYEESLTTDLSASRTLGSSVSGPSCPATLDTANTEPFTPPGLSGRDKLEEGHGQDQLGDWQDVFHLTSRGRQSCSQENTDMTDSGQQEHPQSVFFLHGGVVVVVVRATLRVWSG